MSKTYSTIQGDMWDSIAHKELGDVKYTDALMRANTKHINTYIFSAGVKLVIPDINETVTASSLPPWKKVSG